MTRPVEWMKSHWFDGAADRQLGVVQKMMKILNWNIWDGGVSKKNYNNNISRIGEIARSILSHLPEVAVITEFRNNPLGEELICKLLQTKGTTLAYCHMNKKLRPEDNTVAIFSAFPIKPLNDLLKLGDQFSRHYQCVEINSVIFVAVFCARNVNAMEYIIDAIVNNTELIDQHSVIVGDFDTGPIKSNVKKAIYGFSNDPESNWTNVWLSQNQIEWSHRNLKKNKQGEYGESMPDHIFVSPSLRQLVHYPKYHHSVKDNWISDHSIQTVSVALNQEPNIDGVNISSSS